MPGKMGSKLSGYFNNFNFFTIFFCGFDLAQNVQLHCIFDVTCQRWKYSPSNFTMGLRLQETV